MFEERSWRPRVSTPVTAVDLRDLRKKRDDDDDDGGAKTAPAGREEQRGHVVHGVRIRSDTGDLSLETIHGAKSLDRPGRGHWIAVHQCASHCGGQFFEVAVIARLR